MKDKLLKMNFGAAIALIVLVVSLLLYAENHVFKGYATCVFYGSLLVGMIMLLVDMIFIIRSIKKGDRCVVPVIGSMFWICMLVFIFVLTQRAIIRAKLGQERVQYFRCSDDLHKILQPR